MKVIVIGSGLIGVTAAYFLMRRGCEVTVIEREEGAGRQTSFANGALLTPSMSDPWNAPGCWRVLLGSLGRSDAPLQLRFRTLPSLAGWGLRFLHNSKRSLYERNSLTNLRLALYSLHTMQSLRETTQIEYGRSARGSLRLFRDEAALDRAAAAATELVAENLKFRRLAPAEAVALEPAIAPLEDQLAGALHYGNDEVGDAFRFCEALTASAREQGVEFRFHTEVSRLETDSSGRISAVITDTDRLIADRYLVAAGSYSTPLLRTVGVHLPVQPAKGYSLTFADSAAAPSLCIPVIDDLLHAAVVPLHGAIRVAGTAEFAGFDRRMDDKRIRNLQRLVREVLPHAPLDVDTATPWCGLRPMSVDGVPIISVTSIPNLFVSTGHGHLGWTMAAGSAQLVADLITDERPRIDPAPFELNRFN